MNEPDTRFDQILSLLNKAGIKFSLERLIKMKRAAGRPKDLAELQVLLEERRNRS